MKTYLIAAILLLSMKSFSQGSLTGMKFNLNEDGSKYAVYCLNQIWFRSSQMNPGTMIEESQLLQGQTLETDCAF
jgi:hypothetical protein